MKRITSGRIGPGPGPGRPLSGSGGGGGANSDSHAGGGGTSCRFHGEKHQTPNSIRSAARRPRYSGNFFLMSGARRR